MLYPFADIFCGDLILFRIYEGMPMISNMLPDTCRLSTSHGLLHLDNLFCPHVENSHPLGKPTFPISKS